MINQSFNYAIMISDEKSYFHFSFLNFEWPSFFVLSDKKFQNFIKKETEFVV